MLERGAMTSRRWLAAAVSLMAVGAGAAGAAWAQEGPRVRWDVIDDLPPVQIIRPVPTEQQRQVASEAAALAATHAASTDSQLALTLESASIEGYSHLLPYFDYHETLADPGGLMLLTAFHLYRAEQTDALRQLDQALEGHPDRSLDSARHAIGILLGRAPPPPESLTSLSGRQALVFIAFWMLIDRSVIQGDLDAAGAHAHAMFQYAVDADVFRSPVSLRRARPSPEPSPERMTAALMATRLGELGQLTRASEMIRREALLQGCGVLIPSVSAPVEQLVEAARWAEAADLIASADRSCLPALLARYSTDRFERAGQGRLLRNAIQTALVRPPGRASSDHDFRELLVILLSQGLIEAAEREITLQRELEGPLDAYIEGALAAAAVVRGDRVRVERYWGPLDQLTGGDTAEIAALVAMIGLSSDPAGPWRERAVAWLGLEAAELDQAIARYIRLLDPGRVATSPALASLVRRVVAADREPELQSESGMLDLESGYSLLELRFAAGDGDVVLEEIRTGELGAVNGLLQAAVIAVYVHRDPVLLHRVMALAEEIAGLSARRAFAAAGAPSYSANGLCLVAILALDVAGQADRALELLFNPALVSEDLLIDHCLAGAAGKLAAQGDTEGALKAARAVVSPSIRALALAAAVGPREPPALVDWLQRMRANGVPVPQAPVAPQSPAAGQR